MRKTCLRLNIRRLPLPLTRLITNLYFKYFSGFKPAAFCASNRLDKVFDLYKRKKLAHKGDYYEFGVFKGYTLLYTYKLALKHGFTKMRFFGFDSFCGLPKISNYNDTREFFQGEYFYTLEKVKNNIIQHGGNIDKFYLIQGFYSDSLKKSIIKKYRMGKIAVVNIDCDLYESTKDVLEFIKDLLMPGSIVIFDDWNISSNNNSMGERRAFKEFMNKYPNIKFKKEFSTCWHDQVFSVVNC